ncbi:MAG: M48 family metallopeptidase [Leeuwenhoekiella sp.]
MKPNRVITAILTVLLVISCKTSPFTGNKTLNFVSNDELFPMAFQQYNQFLSENNVVTNTEESRMVKRVGQQIQVAAERYMTALGYPGYLNDYRWEYNLVKDDAANAFCMPGGKIVVYTGILPITESEAGLAMVMGHELAHAMADHGAQRMSAAQVQQGVGLAGGLALGNSKAGQIFNQYYGVGSTVGVMLPFSRSHESQADEIGTIIAAIAGYNPYEAPKLWERMKASSDGQAPPELMSTHPHPETRIAALEKIAPRAVAEAKKFGVTQFKD